MRQRLAGVVARARQRLTRAPRRRDETWAHGAPAGDADLGRLLDRGVDPEVLSRLDLRTVDGPFPDAWVAASNRLLVDRRTPIPVALLASVFQGGPAHALVCLASDISDAAYLLLDGDSATVFIGPDSRLTSGELHCGDGSALIFQGALTCTARPTIDARNGGVILAEHDQLWASDIIVSTDDMHAVRSASGGARINAFGPSIRFGPHVWLGRDVVVAGGASIGAHTVVGMRSLVRAGDYPPGSVLAGTPAKIVRDDVTWTREDLP
jgi:acetyltransferase-like isoleucine patch superfamily enzyme